MIKLVPLEKTAVYREMVEIGRQEGREEGREEGRKEAFNVVLERLVASGMDESEARRMLGLENE